MARLLIPSWNIPGRCDVRAMTYVINAYLRRHDTYHSWFEFDDDDRVVRHTTPNPTDIQYVATKHGEMTAAQWRDHILATPSPLEWDCFRFGVIQRADHFTVYACIDHVHADAMFMVNLFIELNMNYAALVEGGAPIKLPETGSYNGYCVRQRDYTSALTLATPEVVDWVDFLHRNGGTMPKFPLPLGDPSVPCMGDLITVKLMDAHDTDRFESVCTAAGVRFIAGVFACAAIAERELAGVDTYNVITPTTTRRTPADFQTTGWFTGVVRGGNVIRRGGRGGAGGVRLRYADGQCADRTGTGADRLGAGYQEARTRCADALVPRYRSAAAGSSSHGPVAGA